MLSTYAELLPCWVSLSRFIFPLTGKKQIFALSASKAKLNEKQMLSTMTVSFHPSLDDFYPCPAAETEAKFGKAASWESCRSPLLPREKSVPLRPTSML